MYKCLTKCTVYTLLFCTKCKVACTTDVVDVLYILVMLYTLTIANTALHSKISDYIMSTYDYEPETETESNVD